MDVEELIAFLQTFPKGSKIGVTYRVCSDIEILDKEDITFCPASEGAKTVFNRSRRYVWRNGKVMQYDEKTWPKEEAPEFVDVLVFPGN